VGDSGRWLAFAFQSLHPLPQPHDDAHQPVAWQLPTGVPLTLDHGSLQLGQLHLSLQSSSCWYYEYRPTGDGESFGVVRHIAALIKKEADSRFAPA